MNTPAELKYAATHEWVRTDGDLLVIGITDNAQEALGDLVFVGDFKVGAKLDAGQPAGVVESVKAASDIYAPVKGEIVAVNEALGENPGLINEGPYEAWIFKLKPDNLADTAKLLDAAGYEATIV